MGGGHHYQPVNENNLQESDEQIVSKIRPIELIKHNPNLFHKNPFDVSNVLEIVGGVKSLTFGAVGSYGFYWYYAQKLAYTPHNYYVRNFIGAQRVVLGFVLGTYLGYLKFGDRQKLHNAWVAERLRRRYPESLKLHTTDLWKYKGVKARHEYYRWV